METPFQRSVRWKKVWYAGMGHFGHLCAAALAEDDIEYARACARRYAQCHARFMSAWIAQLVAEGREGVRPECVDWFGEGEES